MSDLKFNIGDIVSLKTGGPKMTIEEIETLYENGLPSNKYNCCCSWFVDAELKRSKFSNLALEKEI